MAIYAAGVVTGVAPAFAVIVITAAFMLSMLAPAHLANQVLDEIASAANYF